MTVFLLAMLVGMWGIVFAPSLLKARQHSSPVASVSTFNRSLQALGSGQVTSGGRWVVMPPPPRSTIQARQSSAIERRRRVFTFLVSICAITLGLSLIPGLRWLIWLHIAADVCLVAMVALLISLRAMAVEVSLPGSYSAAPGREAAKERADQSRFEPAGHGYRLVPETLENPLLQRPAGADAPSIKVYRADDPPAMRLTPRPGSLTEAPRGLIDPQLKRVVRQGAVPERKPRMFIDEEEDFLQAQGL